MFLELEHQTNIVFFDDLIQKEAQTRHQTVISVKLEGFYLEGDLTS